MFGSWLHQATNLELYQVLGICGACMMFGIALGAAMRQSFEYRQRRRAEEQRQKTRRQTEGQWRAERVR